MLKIIADMQDQNIFYKTSQIINYDLQYALVFQRQHYNYNDCLMCAQPHLITSLDINMPTILADCVVQLIHILQINKLFNFNLVQLQSIFYFRPNFNQLTFIIISMGTGCIQPNLCQQCNVEIICQKQQDDNYDVNLLDDILQCKQKIEIEQQKLKEIEMQKEKRDKMISKIKQRIKTLQNKKRQSLNYAYNYQITKNVIQNQQGDKQIVEDIVIESRENKQIYKIQQILKEDIMNIIDEVQTNDPELAAKCLDKIVNKSYNEKQLKQNIEIQQAIQKDTSQQQTKNISIFLQCLKQQINSNGVKVVFTKQSSSRSFVSINALSSGLMFNRFKGLQIVLDNQYQYSFKEISESELKYDRFVKYLKKRLVNLYGFDESSIIIHSIKSGSQKVVYSVTIPQNYQQILKKSPQYKKPKLHPYFEALNLSLQDFDEKGYIEFGNEKNDIERRGGWPYYQPVKCIRYGLKVLGKYKNDKNIDNWISMQGVQGQWAVAFHGVRNPFNYVVSQTSLKKTIIQNIVSDKLKPGSNQNYYGTLCVKTGKIITNGIYCSPHIQQALDYANQSSQILVNNVPKKYRLVLHCRVNPNNIQICSTNVYWVIQQPKNIRPYGIILVQSNMYEQIMDRYQNNLPYERFEYQDYKNQL